MFRLLYLIGVFLLILPTARLSFVNSSYSDLFIFCALGVWFWRYLKHRGKDGWDIPLHVLWLPGFLILIGGLVSSVGAVEPLASVEVTIKTVFVVTLWISMSMVMVRQGGLEVTIIVFLAAVCLSAGIGIIDRWTGTSIGDTFSGNRVLFYNRSIGTFGHPNELGFITSVAMPLALGMVLRELRGRRRIFGVFLFAGTFLIGGLGLFYSGSVAGWISATLSTGIFGIIWFMGATVRWRLAFLCGLLVLAGTGALFLRDAGRQAQVRFLLDYNLNRATNITGPGRTYLLGRAFDVIAASPFVGAGMDQTGTGGLTREELVTGDWIHNTLIGGWLSGGILVFFGLLISYLVVFVTALRALRWGSMRAEWLAVGLGACALGWILFDQTQPSLSHRYTWLTLAWLFSMGFTMRWSAPAKLAGGDKQHNDLRHAAPALSPPPTDS